MRAPKIVTKDVLRAARKTRVTADIDVAFALAHGRGWPYRSIARHLGKRNAERAGQRYIAALDAAPAVAVVKAIATASVERTCANPACVADALCTCTRVYAWPIGR